MTAVELPTSPHPPTEQARQAGGRVIAAEQWLHDRGLRGLASADSGEFLAAYSLLRARLDALEADARKARLAAIAALGAAAGGFVVGAALSLYIS